MYASSDLFVLFPLSYTIQIMVIELDALDFVVFLFTTNAQCAVVYCSVLQQCAAACCSVLQCAVVCCSVLQCAAVCCSALQCAAVRCSALQRAAESCSVLQCVASWGLSSLLTRKHLRV